MCKSHQIAATVNGIIDDEQINIIVESVKIDCSCPNSHYWKLSEYSYIDNKLYQVFKCAKVKLFFIIMLFDCINKYKI